MSLLLAFEIIATITGLLCVYLQTKEKVIAWPIAIVSVSLSAWVVFQNSLYSDTVLYLTLFILNFFGWYQWNNRDINATEKIPIKIFENKDWFIWFLVIIAITPVWGFLMRYYFNADMAYLDAFTTVGSLVAQYLLAKKYLQNWIIWIVVDVVCVGLYFYKELYFFTFLSFAYLLLCIKGYLDWKKEVNDYGFKIKD